MRETTERISFTVGQVQNFGFVEKLRFFFCSTFDSDSMWSATISVSVGAVAAVAVMSRHIKVNYDFVCAYLAQASDIQSVLNRLNIIFFLFYFRWRRTMHERWATDNDEKQKETNSNEKCFRISIIILNQHQTYYEYDRLCCEPEHVLWMNSHGKSVGKPIWIYLGIKQWKVSTGGSEFAESTLDYGIYFQSSLIPCAKHLRLTRIVFNANWLCHVAAYVDKVSKFIFAPLFQHRFNCRFSTCSMRIIPFTPANRK